MTGMPFAERSLLGKVLGGAPETSSSGKKEKLPAYVPEELLERLRNTVVGLQRTPECTDPPVSLSAFVEAAVLAAVERAEEEYNDGDQFPRRRNQRLKTGPPIQG